nr:DUF362 domain-containing protein [Candidatus Njordarchaeota archaeon]
MNDHNYSTRDVGTGTMFERRSMRRFLSDIYARYHPETVLEAHCNGISGVPCIASRILAERGCKVTLVNPSQDILNMAEKYWRRRGIKNAEFRNGSIRNLPFESGTFDLVWNFAVVPKMIDPMKALKEMSRVSRNLVLVFSNNSLNFGFPFHQLYHRRTRSEWNHGYIGWMLTSNVRRVMSEAGLKIIESGYVDVPPWPDLDIPIGQVLKGILSGKKGIEGHNAKGAADNFVRERGGGKELLMSIAGHFEVGMPRVLKPFFGHHLFVLARREMGGEAQAQPRVAVVKHKADITKETQLGIDLVGGLNIKGNTVVIKPNLCILDTPESGRTSDTRIVEALLKMLKGSKKKVMIVESGNYDADVAVLYKELGYEKLAEEYGCELVDLKRLPSVKIRISNLRFKFPRFLLKKNNYFISVAKLKTHVFGGISCAWKNQWGLIAQIEKRAYHPFQNEVLCYINSMVKPDLAIIDGIIGMGGVGPVDGHPIETNLLLFGKDIVATDSIASKIMGINPRIVSMLTCAHENGAGEIDPEKIQVVGEDLDKIIHPYDFIPMRAYMLMKLGLRIGRKSKLIRLGMLVFNVGNFMCPRDIHAHGKPSLLKVLKRSLTSKRWKV